MVQELPRSMAVGQRQVTEEDKTILGVAHVVGESRDEVGGDILMYSVDLLGLIGDAASNGGLGHEAGQVEGLLEVAAVDDGLGHKA